MATDIVLKDRNGQDVTYKGIETVTFDTPTEGVQTTFTHGTVVDGVTIEPDFSEGDQVISVPEGALVKTATIKKPADLLPENIRAGRTIGGVGGEFIGNTEELNVDLRFTNVIETELLPMTRYDDFSFHSDFLIYGVQDAAPYTLTVGETYFVEWDGEVCECVAQDAGAVVPGMVYLGNGTNWLLPGNGEKFVIGTANNGYALYGSVEDTEAGGSHTVRIYQLIEGNDTSDMVVTPTAEGKVMSKVTVKKPDELVPENIAEGVNIGGVVGTFKGGGCDFDFSDENVQFFSYRLDLENKQIFLYSILYDVLYKVNGSYDVNIPDKIGGYDVVIVCL